jgi:hypothetical protein
VLEIGVMNVRLSEVEAAEQVIERVFPVMIKCEVKFGVVMLANVNFTTVSLLEVEAPDRQLEGFRRPVRAEL